jgi:hypothetical protein
VIIIEILVERETARFGEFGVQVLGVGGPSPFYTSTCPLTLNLLFQSSYCALYFLFSRPISDVSKISQHQRQTSKDKIPGKWRAPVIICPVLKPFQGGSNQKGQLTTKQRSEVRGSIEKAR